MKFYWFGLLLAGLACGHNSEEGEASVNSVEDEDVVQVGFLKRG